MRRKSLTNSESSDYDEYMESSDLDPFDSSDERHDERISEGNIKKINEYIEKLDILNNKLDLKIKLNQQNEKENLVKNIDNINIYIKKHLSFKNRLNGINNSLKEKCNYDAFSKIEKVYKTISNVNSSYEYITLKIQVQDYVKRVETCIRTNHMDAIYPLSQFLKLRRYIYKYGRSGSSEREGSNSYIHLNNPNRAKGASTLMHSEDTVIENDVIDYVKYKEKQFSENQPEQQNHAHAEAYKQIYQTEKGSINLLNSYYDHVRGLLEEEICECIKSKDMNTIKLKINLYMSIFHNRGEEDSFVVQKGRSVDIRKSNKVCSGVAGNNGEDRDMGSGEDRDKGSGEDRDIGSGEDRDGGPDEDRDEGPDEDLNDGQVRKGNPITEVQGHECPKTSAEEKLLHFDEYLFICHVVMSLVELEVNKQLDLLRRQVVSKEDNVYIECIKGTYACLYRYNKFFESLVEDHIVYIIYNRKVELIFNNVIKAIYTSFFNEIELLHIDSYDELKNFDKNVETLSLLCYNFQNIKKFINNLAELKFQNIIRTFDFVNFINKDMFSEQSGLYKNLPYINFIQNCICAYIDNEIIFIKHCVDKAFVLSDDIMLSLIDDEKNNKNTDFEKFHDNIINFENIMMNNSNEYTSTFLDDAFFIFQKSVCRSINMNDINTICVLVNHIMLFFSTTLKSYLCDNLKISKNIYASFIHDSIHMKQFSFTSLIKSIDDTNYIDEGQGGNRTVTLAQNLTSSLSYVHNENYNSQGRTNHIDGPSNERIYNGTNWNGFHRNDSMKNDLSQINEGKSKEKSIYEYLTVEHYESIFNPLSEKKGNLENQAINSKFSYPHCVNNIDSCYQYIQNFKIFINDYFKEKFLKNKKKKKKKKDTQNYILMFNNSFANYDNLLKDFEKLNVENCKNLLNILKVHFISQLVVIETVNFDISNEEYAYYQLNDPYINNLINRMKLIVYHISLYFNQNIFHTAVNLLAEKICKYIERIVHTKKFSLYGCVQIDNDIRSLMLFFTSLTNINVKKEFSKLLEICELLNISDLQDFKDFYDENKNNLSTNEIENIISLRNDISKELLESIKLCMHSNPRYSAHEL
ncbi:hypothetical protein, conserved [Plasmodium gonderi]|uniref:Conserved oligomeric Golgi complex subunit 4 C-terminal domain-containing protein n=1 Tax=Plasmodium gonderi TaxID=77519 RepID=A0A1Y1JKA9_PLAGO|nr:hypothetical protein, conserved [Plasmodium gonderi]GAW81865.1 hypothetical protein, conserved [Plasmodium gonderi]